jgi:hypothetical protein
MADDWAVSKSFGVPGESARQQAEKRRKRREELERLARREEDWDGGAVGEESTAEWIGKRCPSAVALHDRRMPHSRSNIDHIVLVPSGVWIIDSKRVYGRIKVEERKNGTQKLVINGADRTDKVHKITAQVNAVTTVLAELDARVPVYGAFCFHLPADHRRELLNPFFEDSGLPLLRTWTIDGYPLFYPRQMCRRLNSPGTLSIRQADALAASLVERFPPAIGLSSTDRGVPLAPHVDHPKVVVPGDRLSKENYKAEKEAEQAAVWKNQRGEIEAALGTPLPPILMERLGSDSAIWCHHALWHARVYLACVHGRVGQSFAWKEAGSLVARLHSGRMLTAQWAALNTYLEHLRAHGYVDFSNPDGRITDVAVTADFEHAPTR